MPLQTLRTTDIRLNNKLHVLQFIRQRKEVTKPEIEKNLGFSAPTVSALVDELVDESFVLLSGTGSSTDQGGKRPKIFAFHPSGKCVVGVHIGVKNIQAALMDFEANIIHQVSHQLKSKTGSDELISMVESLVQECILHASRRSMFLLGIGIGCPGVVDFDNGKVLRSINQPVLESVDFQQWAQQYDYPVWIDNECNNLALAEKWFGMTETYGTSLNLLTENGIGAGIIIDGQLIRGESYSFGEVGHMVIEQGGKLCHCGNRGCWETKSSTTVVLEAMESRAGESPIIGNRLKDGRELTLDDIADALREGEAVALKVAVDELSESLAVGLTNLVNIFNPNVIIIHGEMTKLGERLLTELQSKVKASALPIPAGKVRIAFSKLGDNWHLIGAGALCIKELFDLPDALFRK